MDWRGEGPCSGLAIGRARLRRQRIIDAARNLFIANGFHATGVAQIAKVSGVAVGQIYRDFAAKEDIVASIVERDCASLLERESLRRAVAAQDAAAAWDWLRNFIKPTAPRETLAMFAEIVAESTRNERIAAIFTRTRTGALDDLLTALALLAPGEHIAGRRELLAEMMMTQSLGLKQERLLRDDLETEPLVDLMMGTIAREIENLLGAIAPLEKLSYR